MVLLCAVMIVVWRGGKPKKGNSDAQQTVWKPMEVTKNEEKVCEEKVAHISEAYEKMYTEDEAEVLTREEREEVLHNIGKFGYAAADVQNRLDMEHASKLISFYGKSKAKEKADVSVVCLKIDGGISLMELSTENGETIAVLTTAGWDEHRQLDISEIVKYKVKKLWMTSKGYLFCEFYLSDQAELQSNGLIGIRTKPLKKESVTLCERYLNLIGYRGNNLFLVDWKEGDTKEINYNDLFQYLYIVKYGEEMNRENKKHGIVASEFEEVITTYLPISKRQLRKDAIYHQKSQRYEWSELGSGNYMPGSVPLPEVVDYKQKGNILTITVDAIWVEKGKDDAFTHVVKIKESKDGSFCYLSNQIVPSKNNIIPNYNPRVRKGI